MQAWGRGGAARYALPFGKVRTKLFELVSLISGGVVAPWSEAPHASAVPSVLSATKAFMFDAMAFTLTKFASLVDVLFVR